MRFGPKVLLPWVAAGLLLLPATAALADNAEPDSDVDDTLNAQCTGTLPVGSYRDVVVPVGANCTVPSGVQIFRDLTVQAGGTLTLQGGAIGNDLRANRPASLSLGGGATIGHDLRVDGGAPGPDTADRPGPGAGPGPARDDHPAPPPAGAPGPGTASTGPVTICGLTVDNSVDVRGGSGTVVVGDTSHGCGSGLTIGQDLRVDHVAGAVYVGDNTVYHDLRVQSDLGGGEVVRNHVGNNATCEPLTGFSIGGNTVDEDNRAC